MVSMELCQGSHDKAYRVIKLEVYLLMLTIVLTTKLSVLLIGLPFDRLGVIVNRYPRDYAGLGRLVRVRAYGNQR